MRTQGQGHGKDTRLITLSRGAPAPSCSQHRPPSSPNGSQTASPSSSWYLPPRAQASRQQASTTTYRLRPVQVLDRPCSVQEVVRGSGQGRGRGMDGEFLCHELRWYDRLCRDFVWVCGQFQVEAAKKSVSLSTKTNTPTTTEMFKVSPHL